MKRKRTVIRGQKLFLLTLISIENHMTSISGWHLLTEIRRVMSTYNKLKQCPNKGYCASSTMNYHLSSSSLSLWPLNLTVRTNNSLQGHSPQIHHLSCRFPVTPLPSKLLLRGYRATFCLSISLSQWQTHQCPLEFLFQDPLCAKTNQADFTICVTHSAGYISTSKMFFIQEKI